MEMVTDIHAPLSQKPFQKPKGIMRYMIENYWPLYDHLKNGDTIFKGRLILPRSYQIIKI